MEKDIFNLTDISDLPKEVREELNSDPFGDRVIKLFKMANRSLSMDEITVGYYRLYKEEDLKTKRQLTVKVYNMSRERNPSIESVKGKKGVYRLIDKDNA